MRRFASVLVGGGAAGTAMLIAASKQGLLPELAHDLCVLERGPSIGAGRLGRYAINSDSTAATFLSAVRDNPIPELAALIDHPSALAIEGFGRDAAVPLATVGRFLDAVGAVLHALITRAGGVVMTGQQVTGARRCGAGWSLSLAGHSQAPVMADRVVLATGAGQPLDRLAREIVAGEPLVARVADRLVQSDELLCEGGLETLNDRLVGREQVRIAIIGGSTSALAAANRLLRDPHAPPFARGGLTILHRSPLTVFYPSDEAARGDGHHDFGSDHICPVSGFVHRFGGLRLDARELVRRQLGRSGDPDPRLRFHAIQPGRDIAALAILDKADLVIPALGYRPCALPLSEGDGRPLPLAADAGQPLVDANCQVVAADGQALPGLYAIGLAAGFRPTGELGGEAAFKGQVNGLWLWQNGVGALIARALAASNVRRAAA